MEIITTLPGMPQFDLFEAVPGQLYAPESPRLRQRDGLNRAFLHRCLVAVREGVPVARLAVYLNPNLRYNGLKTVAFGNYECLPDAETAQQLLAAAIAVAREAGAECVVGPMNGSTWDNYRFSVHHDHPNFLLEPYHHLYYNDQFTAAGFEVISRYTSQLDRTMQCNDPAVLQRGRELQKQGVIVRSIDRSDFEGELRRLYPFISAAFQTNFLYSPIEWEAFRDKYLEAAPIIDPRYVLIAEDADRNPIGFIFAYRNLVDQVILRNHPVENELNAEGSFVSGPQLVIKTVARSFDRRWSGLGHVLGNAVISAAKEQGFTSVIHAFMIEAGTSTGVSQNFKGNSYKNYRLYGRSI